MNKERRKVLLDYLPQMHYCLNDIEGELIREDIQGLEASFEYLDSVMDILYESIQEAKNKGEMES